ncbi:glycoside hydrolase family 3 N-terminal domain-containing protein [Desertivirga xinjiangensis]|uniref:glycoside hydrolase family 3 N-terminal domain-containing protein n=1 Tax=Desertivirga xinjiangensis TaxID=539206 RepID=UPI00210C5132|nr:glycoside hydrolase family 3 N-terminal domain-containing protein [Pedobacter xinjiangensis]
MRINTFIYISFILVSAKGFSQTSNYIDRNGNGRQDVFENPARTPDERIQDLMRQMSIEEKVGQMVQYPVPSFVGDPNSPDEFVTRNKKQTAELKKLVEKGLIGSVHANLRETPRNIQQSVSQVNKWLDQSRLKIPFLVAVDAVHGNSLAIGATVFPSTINMGASFDETLSYKVADATSKECVVLGQNWTMGPNIEVARDMRWGRIGETFGEDPLLVSRLGVATIKGFQKELSHKYSMATCAKHFIAGSQPSDGRNNSPTDVSERTLREVFYPPFKAAFEAGVASVMLAHNEVNGIPCHSDSTMINDWIKAHQGFSGVVISDYMDVPRLVSMHHVAANESDAYRMAVKAGLDMNMMGPGFYEPVLEGVKSGEVPLARIDDAVKRILYIKFRLGLFDKVIELKKEDLSIIANAGHKALALEAARKSIALLKNNKNILPIKTGTQIFLTGPLANNEAILGDWVAPFEHSNSTTVLKGFTALAGKNNLTYFDCGSLESITDKIIAEAVEKSSSSEVIVIVAGQNPNRSSAPGTKTEGENIDRNTLVLPGNQAALVNKLAETGKPVIIVYINGGPIADDAVEKNAAAIINAFYPGMAGGQAIAEIIYGKVNPSAKMPYSVPRGTGYLNSWYNQRPSKYSTLRGRYAMDEISNGVTPLYDFGYGLSYTQFVYSDLKVPASIKKGESFEISVRITNQGKMEGEEVAMLFMNDIVSRVTTPLRQLTDFKRIHLKTGESKVLKFLIKPEQLMYLNEKLNLELEKGDFRFTVGTHSSSPQTAILQVN